MFFLDYNSMQVLMEKLIYRLCNVAKIMLIYHFILI